MKHAQPLPRIRCLLLALYLLACICMLHICSSCLVISNSLSVHGSTFTIRSITLRILNYDLNLSYYAYRPKNFFSNALVIGEAIADNHVQENRYVLTNNWVIDSRERNGFTSTHAQNNNSKGCEHYIHSCLAQRQTRKKAKGKNLYLIVLFMSSASALLRLFVSAKRYAFTFTRRSVLHDASLQIPSH